MRTELLEKCEKCGAELVHDDDDDFDGARYIGGSKYTYCPNGARMDDHTFRRYV